MYVFQGKVFKNMTLKDPKEMNVSNKPGVLKYTPRRICHLNF